MHHSDPTQQSPDTRFTQLLSRHEPVVRAYLRTLVATAASVDELMPEVALVAWRKFSTLTDPEGFPQWACVIARYEVLRWRRDKARDRLVLDEDVFAKLADEGQTSTTTSERQLTALEGCLQKLPGDRRDLMLACHTPGITTRDMARRTGRKEDALYQLVRRLRHQLHCCIESTLLQEDPI
jgi:RNA polymerase sigma-70 factor, ECF subfamily